MVGTEALGRLTDRDVDWLRWVGRWRGVTAAQVAEWFLPETASRVPIVERRARVWVSLGLTRAEPVLAQRPRLHVLRSAGMRAVGIEGPVRHVSVGTAAHDLAVVDLATWWHQRGEQVITEREIRAGEPMRSDVAPVMSLPAVLGAGRTRLFPDLLTVEPPVGGRPMFTAHEVELAPKPTARLVALMRSYGASPHHRRVVYYVPENRLTRVKKAAEIANDAIGESTVFVRGWVWES